LVVEQRAKEIGIEHFGGRDLRRTCAKLCRKNGGTWSRSSFLLGHASIQTTERYLGSEQELAVAVNDSAGSKASLNWHNGPQQRPSGPQRTSGLEMAEI
jgi:integrase